MRRIIALLLVVVSLLCLSACGFDPEAVDKALQGTWEASNATYTFKDGTFTCEVDAPGIYKGPRDGTYKLEQGVLILSFSNDVTGSLDFTYKDNTLVFDNGMQKTN